jgi:hypothetical protein
MLCFKKSKDRTFALLRGVDDFIVAVSKVGILRGESSTADKSSAVGHESSDIDESVDEQKSSEL